MCLGLLRKGRKIRQIDWLRNRNKIAPLNMWGLFSIKIGCWQVTSKHHYIAKVIPHPEWSKATLSTQLVAEELYLRIEDNKNKNLTTKTTRSNAVRKIHLQVFPWALFHLNGHQHGCEVSEWWKRDPSKDTLKIFRKKHRFVPSCLPIGMALAMEIVWISFDEE